MAEDLGQYRPGFVVAQIQDGDRVRGLVLVDLLGDERPYRAVGAVIEVAFADDVVDGVVGAAVVQDAAEDGGLGLEGVRRRQDGPRG